MAWETLAACRRVTRRRMTRIDDGALQSNARVGALTGAGTPVVALIGAVAIIATNTLLR
jgi:hypothetical protein